MARYGRAYKERIVGRLLPPESAALDVVSREVGVSVATLERWRAQALADGAGSGGGQRWTAAARLEAVIATAAMDEASRSAEGSAATFDRHPSLTNVRDTLGEPTSWTLWIQNTPLSAEWAQSLMSPLMDFSLDTSKIT